MASRIRKANSYALAVLLFVTAAVAMGPTTATASTPLESDACLVINEQDELVSADACTGEIVVPASVRTVKSRSFFNFKGSVSFAANSQLQTVEQEAFSGGTGRWGSSLKSIVFPPSLQSIEPFAVNVTSSTSATIYFEGLPAQRGLDSVSQAGAYTIVQPRGAQLLQLQNSFTPGNPFQIDCNSIDGVRDYLAASFVALELHNCADPRNHTAANPPSTMGYILNRGLNESVDLQSADGTRSGSVRLHQLGYDGHRLAFVQDLAASSFSTSVFGDEYQSPRGVQLTCSLDNSTPLPAGVSLNSSCNLIAADTTSLGSSTTDIRVNWTASNGVSNAFDVGAASATPSPVPSIQGSVNVRVSLRRASQLTAGQLFQMQLLSAKYSGTIRDWNLAVASYRALPNDQVPAGAPDAGISATTALEGFESGAVSESVASAALSTFSGEAAAGSTYLGQLRTRLNLQSVTNQVVAFETNGLWPKIVRQSILALPASTTRTALLARFTVKVNQLFSQSAVTSSGNRTIAFTNPYRVESFTVPAGVAELNIEIRGAEGSQGGFEGANRAERAGHKGLVTGRIAVSTGQVLTIGVGEAAGAAPSTCLAGKQTLGEDSAIARGGTNPLGGYSGGDGGTPGTSNCSGYGGAGGAASVVQVGSVGNPGAIATLVAGGSAGSAGASDDFDGPIGSATLTARGDFLSTDGQAPYGLTRYVYWDYPGDPDDGGGSAGGGGGAIGGATGGYNITDVCGFQDFCPLASSPGQNSTGGQSGLSASYVRYTFDDLMNANGSVTISFVEPPVATPTPTPTPTSTPSPTPTPTQPPAPEPIPTPTSVVPDAPRDLKVEPFWKGAEVSWLAPTSDGGAAIQSYVAKAASGQTCQTDQLFCRISGLVPGQLIELSVIARNSVGDSKPAIPSGPKVFAPLSLNLWQTKFVAKKPVVKVMNAAQLAKLRAMLILDESGFALQVRVAKNSSPLNNAALNSLLSKEVTALGLQLKRAGLLSKVQIKTQIVPGNPKAPRPSVILISTKP